MSTNAEEPHPIATDRTPAWDLVRATLEHLYRGKSIGNRDSSLVLADMSERDQIGRVKYGVPLTSHNGRDLLVDAYQEGLDFVVYLAAELDERGVELAASDSPMLGMSDDTRELYEMLRTSIVRLIGLRGIIRRRGPKVADDLLSKRADDLLSKLYRLQADGQIDDALDLVTTSIDTDLKQTQGALTNLVLTRVNVDPLEEDLLVGLLTATFAGKSLIPARGAFVDRVRERLLPKIGPDAVSTFLRELT